MGLLQHLWDPQDAAVIGPNLLYLLYSTTSFVEIRQSHELLFRNTYLFTQAYSQRADIRLTGPTFQTSRDLDSVHRWLIPI